MIMNWVNEEKMEKFWSNDVQVENNAIISTRFSYVKFNAYDYNITIMIIINALTALLFTFGMILLNFFLVQDWWTHSQHAKIIRNSI